MRHLQTVGARLALALLLVVAAVLAFVYLIVTPSLEDRLIGSAFGVAIPVLDFFWKAWMT